MCVLPCCTKCFQFRARRIAGLGTDWIGSVIKKGRVRWFARVECKDGADWVKHCVTVKVVGITQRGDLSET